MSRRKERLEPRRPGRLDFFVCGPTVCDFSHLGHAKTYTQFDFIVRYLRNRGCEVFYLQNITDIDDKIIDRARLRGLSPAALAEQFTEYFLEDMTALHNTNVSKYARAHDFIPEIIDQIKRLIAKGRAYWTQDGYYFDLSSFGGYGKLSQRSEMRPEDAVSRVDENPLKRHPGDFCLWKARKPDEPFWAPSWAKGGQGGTSRIRR
jgi:cysteinyl-tRNA synthetase